MFARNVSSSLAKVMDVCLFRMLCFAGREFMRRVDHLPRVVLPSAAYPMSIIVKPCNGGHFSLSGRSSK